MPSPAHQSYGTMVNSQSSVRDAEEDEEKDLEETLETELKDDPRPSPLMESPVAFQWPNLFSSRSLMLKPHASA